MHACRTDEQHSAEFLGFGGPVDGGCWRTTCRPNLVISGPGQDVKQPLYKTGEYFRSSRESVLRRSHTTSSLGLFETSRPQTRTSHRTYIILESLNAYRTVVYGTNDQDRDKTICG